MLCSTTFLFLLQTTVTRSVCIFDHLKRSAGQFPPSLEISSGDKLQSIFKLLCVTASVAEGTDLKQSQCLKVKLGSDTPMHTQKLIIDLG